MWYHATEHEHELNDGLHGVECLAIECHPCNRVMCDILQSNRVLLHKMLHKEMDRLVDLEAFRNEGIVFPSKFLLTIFQTYDACFKV